MARLLLAALALSCCLGLQAAGRTLLLTDQQAQAQLQGLDQVAGTVFSQLSDAVTSSGVLTPPSSSSSYSKDLQDKTIDYINHHAPLWMSDMGYFIRPQLSSALYNAVNHLGPAEPTKWVQAPAEAPAAAQAAPAGALAAQMAPTTAEGGRRLLQADSYSYAYTMYAPAAAPAAAPAVSAEGTAAFAPLGAAELDDAASPDADLFTSYAKKKKKKAATSSLTGPSAASTNAAPAGGMVTSVNKQNQQLSAMSPSAAAAARATAAANSAGSTSLAQDLQPKSTILQNGVSLDPNLPNALPGPLRLATEQQAKSSGYSPQPMSATAATDGTAFAGTPVNKLPGPLRIDATTPFDGPSVSGSEISLIVGTRIATPFFGTGFNFCVDRYFGSFPKVGIVIPNPAQWLLPELQDIGRTLQTTLQLPPDATIGHGFTLQPTSDGLLISLPDGVQPNNIPDGGVRYGIQIGQAFGYDFGIGIIRDICFISFTTV